MPKCRLSVLLPALALAVALPATQAQPKPAPAQPRPAQAAPAGQAAPQPLEEFDLERLRLAGTGKDAQGPYARVRAPGGKTYELRKDGYAGKDHGLVTAVRADRVELKQLINLTGSEKNWIEAPGVIESRQDARPNARWDALMKAADQAYRTDAQAGLKLYQDALAVALGIGARDPRVARSYEAIGMMLLTSGEPAGEFPLLRALSVYRNGFAVDSAAIERVKKTLRQYYAITKAPPEAVKALDAEPPQ